MPPAGGVAAWRRAVDRAWRQLTLRMLHAAMDRAVLDAYGWADVRPTYDFRPQLDERVRYTWDDDTRDEVRARLLEENRRAAATVSSWPSPSQPRAGLARCIPAPVVSASSRARR